MKNLVRRALTAIFVIACMISATIVGAAVQIFDGKGEWHTSDAENQQIAMARASQRARLDAQKKAGVYLKTFSRSVNLELVDDEISAVTNNIIEIVGDVHFDKKIIPLSDNQTTILYTATLKAKIDPDGIYDFVKRSDKANIVQQNTQLQNAIQKNDELSASLTEQYNRTTSQAERDKIRQQMNDADRDFLANQKLEEGNKLSYAKNYNGAIKLYNEALQIKPNYADAYYNRGTAYAQLKQYEKALQDLNKTLQLNPNDAEAYTNRGVVYSDLGDSSRAISDYNKAIQLSPNLFEAYINRGVAYSQSRQYERAIQDYSKAIQLNPRAAVAYNNRGNAYQRLKQYEPAIQDYDKAIQLNPGYSDARYNCAVAYFQRGMIYGRDLGQYEMAIQCFNKSIQFAPNIADVYCNRGYAYYLLGKYQQALEDFNKTLTINPNHEYAKNNRALCLKAMGK